MLSRNVWIQLVGFGLVIFIWTIQLVVYPSFRYFPSDCLLKWHGVYTGAVSIIVVPLMVTQVVLHGWRLCDEFALVRLLIFILVLSAWLVTFLIFVPLHNKISSDRELTQSLANLVSYNWVRTVLWSLIFLVGVLTARK